MASMSVVQESPQHPYHTSHSSANVHCDKYEECGLHSVSQCSGCEPGGMCRTGMRCPPEGRRSYRNEPSFCCCSLFPNVRSNGGVHSLTTLLTQPCCPASPLGGTSVATLTQLLAGAFIQARVCWGDFCHNVPSASLPTSHLMGDSLFGRS